MEFKRYALYYTPPQDADWARLCTGWLGWDMATGTPIAPPPGCPELPAPLAEITKAPRRYGLHATVKPPFYLAPGHTAAQLATACAVLCASLAPVHLQGLHLARLGRFLALRPSGDETALRAIAATGLRDLDRFRAAPTDADLARRRAAGLSPAQETNLTTWGYPYVLDDFRFHITLTGRLPRAALAATEAALHQLLDASLPEPFTIDTLSLAGEDEDGRFHLIHRYALSG